MIAEEQFFLLKKFPLVLATRNPGKLREIQQYLQDVPISIIDAGSLNLPEPIESGKTFTENAIIKAQETMIRSGYPSLADDSGICIEALDGAPGVHTADWFVDANGKRDFTVGFNKIKNLIEPGASLAASMHTVLVLAIPGHNAVIIEGSIHGKILLNPDKIDHYFPFDCFFIPEGYDKPFIEQMHIKDKISARAQAMQALKAQLLNMNKL